ncbi:MAG TPA: type 2 isopentenyl-diphosphate Delta-isomerase [Kofleriaceae bacterium]
MPDEPAIAKRKADHLEVAASGRADFKATTLLEHVHLIHQALPELALADIDLTTRFVGKELRAPLLITGMTGGTAEATAINRDLARAAQAAGVAFGVGSQRAMAEHPELAASYQVRDVAPDVTLLGNLGGVQALGMGPDRIVELARQIGADAIAIHLNPGQEMIQSHGDRDFRGVRDAIARLVAATDMPIIVKETGCGLSVEAARMLAGAGVETVDVAGAGGTSWVAVEAERAAADSSSGALGNELREWGIPTAVSVVACVRAGHTVVASGGMRSGYDVARALALGARIGGMAAPLLRAHRAGGLAAVTLELERIIESIRTVCLLTGSASAAALARAPRHLGAPLRSFLEDLSL